VYLSSELSINEAFDGHQLKQNYFWASGQCDGEWAVRDVAAFLCDNPDYDPENACVCECDPNCGKHVYSPDKYTPSPTRKKQTPRPTKKETPAPTWKQVTTMPADDGDEPIIIFTCEEAFAVDEETAICFSDIHQEEVVDGWTNGGVSGKCDPTSKKECTDSFEFPLLVPHSEQPCNYVYGELAGHLNVERTFYFYNCDDYSCDCSTVYEFSLQTDGDKNLDELDVVVDSAQVSSVDFENYPVVQTFEQEEQVREFSFEMTSMGCPSQFYFTVRAVTCSS